jgi:hypothetical protein
VRKLSQRVVNVENGQNSLRQTAFYSKLRHSYVIRHSDTKISFNCSTTTYPGCQTFNQLNLVVFNATNMAQDYILFIYLILMDPCIAV